MEKDQKDEILPLVDEHGLVIGSATRSECHTNPKLIHPVVHLHVFNSKGEIYLQKRAMSKDLFPGFWDTAVGGHIGAGEAVEIALERETLEELSFKVENARLVAQYIWRNQYETEYTYTFVTTRDADIRFNPAEIDEGGFFSKSELSRMTGKGICTPNLENEIGLLENILPGFLRK
jgi:isopentenyldiphosphate isomerase